jgi:predicted O-methyltransferase YrrM
MGHAGDACHRKSARDEPPVTADRPADPAALGLAGEQPAGEGLEIGAGSGAVTAQLLSAFPGLRIVATDYDARHGRRGTADSGALRGLG